MDVLQSISGSYGVLTIALAFGVMFFAAFTKGTIGFALPMIVVSGIGSLMSLELALAAIVIPSLVTNFIQALRQGSRAAFLSVMQYWRLFLVTGITIYFSAQLFTVMPEDVLFKILGIFVVTFSIIQLAGWKPYLPPAVACRAEPFVGLVSGFFGGISGIWGPPILMYLLATHVPKTDMVRIQGIAFLTGSVIFTIAHIQSGVLNTEGSVWSLVMLVPALIGLFAGFKLQDRIPQDTFRTAVLVVLFLVGLNLLRRGLFG